MIIQLLTLQVYIFIVLLNELFCMKYFGKLERANICTNIKNRYLIVLLEDIKAF